MDSDLAPTQTQEHVDVELIPGTEIMRDHDGVRLERGNHSHSVLVPQPSFAPSDPLNWSRPWKYFVTFTWSLYVFVAVMSALSLAPMNGLLAVYFKLEGTQIGLLTGVCVLTLGYANFIIVPCSNIFGRRVTGIVFAVFAVATTVWEGAAKSHGSFLGARAMNGIATATAETMMVQIIADMFFVHERGKWMGVYFASYFMGLFLGPVIAGNIAERAGWRSFFWLSAGLAGLNLINLIFGAPETRWSRRAEHPAPDVDLANIPNASSDINSSDDDKQAVRHVEHTLEDGPKDNVHPPLGLGRPSRAQFSLLQPIASDWKLTLFRDVLAPWTKFFNPIILWAGFMVAGPANLLLLWNLTESSLLGAPPYNFTPSQIGYTNFAFAVGGIVGLITAGPLSDYLAKRSTERNGMIREAESRLPALIPFCVLTIIGMVIGGIGYQRVWSWPSILVVAFGFTGLCVTSIPTIAIAYAVDCFTPISGDIMVVATVLKNTLGFGMSYWVFDVEASNGILTVAMIQFALVVAPMVLTIPIYYYGKSLRRMTKDSSWHKR
ncbi:hypothetical protein P7C73_g1699, partial [Tremellales sp. Uapishka_1]